jgi:hypothetical protein
MGTARQPASSDVSIIRKPTGLPVTILYAVSDDEVLLQRIDRNDKFKSPDIAAYEVFHRSSSLIASSHKYLQCTSEGDDLQIDKRNTLQDSPEIFEQSAKASDILLCSCRTQRFSEADARPRSLSFRITRDKEVHRWSPRSTLRYYICKEGLLDGTTTLECIRKGMRQAAAQ